ncbi:MAG: hypothetical protein M3Y57_03255 [Acidobacteriota bacterium]|nr:hypothetical protein [Acidobacteriota bacterium]
MAESDASSAVVLSPAERTLPTKVQGLKRRDYAIIPALIVLSALLTGCLSEILARTLWPARMDDPCFLSDATAGPHHRANCSVSFKGPETSPVTLRFNDCGYRSVHSCKAPLAPGTVRIVLLGSSDVMGYYTRYEQTFGSELETEIRSYTGTAVEVQNMACDFFTPGDAVKRLREIIDLHPSLVVYPLTRNDVQHSGPPQWVRVPWTTRLIARSRAVLMGQHFLYGDDRVYLRQFLANRQASGFLRTPLPKRWKNYLVDADVSLGRLTDGLHASGIQLLLAALPQQAETALLSSNEIPPGLDPHQFARLIGEIAKRRRASYIDIDPKFTKKAGTGEFYYRVNAHLKPEAHREVTAVLAPKIVKLVLASHRERS